jgi:PAS domain S-box-containing protein
MIWKVDPITFNINYVSNSEERMLGYPKSEFLKMNIRDILQGETLNRITMKGNQMIKEGATAETYHRFKCSAICKNGGMKDLESVVSVITDSFGLKEFLGVTRDVTEANRYEQKLKETVSQLETLVETLPAKIFMKDSSNRYVLVNSGFAQSIGLPALKITGSKSEDITMPEDYSIIVNQDEEILKTGISYLNQDILVKNTDGTQTWYSVSQVPYGEDGKIMGIIGFMVDISKQKHYEKVLEEALNRTKIQKNELENSTRGIHDSMNYAKRIQDALLAPSFEVINNYIPNSFLYYKPKDIVGGDFVYACTTADGLVCAVADCTGHGTPGALMSVMAISLLNDIFGMTIWKHTPADVLEELRRRVISTFSNSMVERESFDICMIFKEFNSDKIMYSGANLPLYICRDNNLIKLDEVRCPIGAHPKQENFVNSEFRIKKGDMLYLASDGYGDQFGHIENRRYYQSDFAQLLARISSHNLREQLQDLEDVYLDWKGDRKQTDDITIFGIRVSEINEENAI